MDRFSLVGPIRVYIVGRGDFEGVVACGGFVAGQSEVVDGISDFVRVPDGIWDFGLRVG